MAWCGVNNLLGSTAVNLWHCVMAGIRPCHLCDGPVPVHVPCLSIGSPTCLPQAQRRLRKSIGQIYQTHSGSRWVHAQSYFLQLCLSVLCMRQMGDVCCEPECRVLASLAVQMQVLVSRFPSYLIATTHEVLCACRNRFLPRHCAAWHSYYRNPHVTCMPGQMKISLLAYPCLAAAHTRTHKPLCTSQQSGGGQQQCAAALHGGSRGQEAPQHF